MKKIFLSLMSLSFAWGAEFIEVQPTQSMQLVNSILREIRPSNVRFINLTGSDFELLVYEGREYQTAPNAKTLVENCDYSFEWSAGKKAFGSKRFFIKNYSQMIHKFVALTERNFSFSSEVLNFTAGYYVHELETRGIDPGTLRFNLSFEDQIPVVSVDLNIAEQAKIDHIPPAIMFHKPLTCLNRYIKEIEILSSLYSNLPAREDIFKSTPPTMGGPKIPKINHRMWLNPNHEAPMPSLIRYTENIVVLGHNWQHIFWCLATYFLVLR